MVSGEIISRVLVLLIVASVLMLISGPDIEPAGTAGPQSLAPSVGTVAVDSTEPDSPDPMVRIELRSSAP